MRKIRKLRARAAKLLQRLRFSTVVRQGGVCVAWGGTFKRLWGCSAGIDEYVEQEGNKKVADGPHLTLVVSTGMQFMALSSWGRHSHYSGVIPMVFEHSGGRDSEIDLPRVSSHSH